MLKSDINTSQPNNVQINQSNQVLIGDITISKRRLPSVKSHKSIKRKIKLTTNIMDLMHSKRNWTAHTYQVDKY